MNFNQNSRKTNALLTSAWGTAQQLLQVVGNFIYRTVFLLFLTKEYLGINGLFTNVLQLFSLAELGIGSAIIYSMYKPFAQQDVPKINALVYFYKRVYTIIGVIVLAIGIVMYPFLHTIVDVSEVPADVNLTLVYFLFVIQSVSSYLFVYKQSVLTADQRSHVVSLFTCGLQLSGILVKIVVLLLSKNYELVLFCEIFVNILLNWLFSLWISSKYRTLFQGKNKLTKEEKQKIYTDTGGLLCHKIGAVIVASTDNIILSKYVSLAAVGIYSNYAIIIQSITNVAVRLFSSMVPSIANYVLTKTVEESRGLFKRLLFANLWFASFTTVCLYLLINPFICIWLDESFLLTPFAVVWICLQHFLQVSRLTASNFINSCGLFAKDRIRPLIESAINLVVSTVLAKHIGIAGVFIGTCVSGILTYYWREPFLVYKNYFKSGQWEYWLTVGTWLLLTAGTCWGGSLLLSLLGDDMMGFVAKVLITGIVPNLLVIALFCHTDPFRYFMGFVTRKLQALKNRV